MQIGQSILALWTHNQGNRPKSASLARDGLVLRTENKSNIHNGAKTRKKVSQNLLVVMGHYCTTISQFWRTEKLFFFGQQPKLWLQSTLHYNQFNHAAVIGFATSSF